MITVEGVALVWLDDELARQAQRYESTEHTLNRLWRNGVPHLSTLLYARWWQLETWLRELVYVELQAKYGVQWIDHLPKKAEQYEKNDQGQTYMASADGALRIAYLDVGPLFALIDSDDYWELFEGSLIDRNVWRGRVIELQKIRKSIAHCRRSHSDDALRMGQTLRDLEHGAFRSLAAFNRQFRVDANLSDPVVAALFGEGSTTADLIAHAQNIRDIGIQLSYSFRPWVATGSRSPGAPISGCAGYLWHMSFYYRDSWLQLDRWWKEYVEVAPEVRDYIIYVTCDNLQSISISFAAVNDAEKTNCVIRHLLDGIMYFQKRPVGEDYHAWESEEIFRLSMTLDARIHLGSKWSVVGDETTPITIFQA